MTHDQFLTLTAILVVACLITGIAGYWIGRSDRDREVDDLVTAFDRDDLEAIIRVGGR